MKSLRVLTVLAIALVSVAACGGVVSYPTPSESTAQPTTAGGITTSPVPATATLPPTMAPTVVVTGTVLPGGNLTGSEMRTLIEESLQTYPWEISLTAQALSATTPITGVVEAESATRVQATLNEPIASYPAMIGVVVISPTIYLKIAGVPDSLLGEVGLKANEWGKLDVSLDTLGLAATALSAANPARLLAGMGYQGLISPTIVTSTQFDLVGTEQVDGVMTNVYENQSSIAGIPSTLKVAVGVDDSRVHQLVTTDPLRTATLTMTYLSSLTIEPPIP